MNASVEDILAELNPRRAKAKICTRSDLNERHAELEERLSEAQGTDLRENRPPEAPQVAQEIVDLEAEMQAAQREFVFASIGRRAWYDLIGQHPPTKDQARDGLDHDPATFPIAAIAASCVAPKMTADQARQLDERLSLGQFRKLWAACLDANLGDDASPKSLAATALLRVNAEYSTTAVPDGSLAASS